MSLSAQSLLTYGTKQTQAGPNIHITCLLKDLLIGCRLNHMATIIMQASHMQACLQGHCPQAGGPLSMSNNTTYVVSNVLIHAPDNLKTSWGDAV